MTLMIVNRATGMPNAPQAAGITMRKPNKKRLISSSQFSATPLAGSTRLFHRACRWRPVRHRTSQAQAAVPSSAKSSAGQENLGTNSGASRATLAAVEAGKPLCIAA